MTIRPLKPYIRDANEDLSQVDQFFCDPVDSERGSCDCSNHEVTWGDGAVLPQRFGRIPYALTSKVAMQRRDHRPVISLQCVAFHRGTLKPDFFSFPLRYPACSLSKRSSSLGHRITEVGPNLGCGFFWPDRVPDGQSLPLAIAVPQ